MKPLFALTLIIAAGCATRTEQATTAPTLAPAVDAAVDAALAKGKATLPQFVAALKNPQTNQKDFSVYAFLSDGDKIEYFYLDDTKLKSDSFEGTIGAQPKIIGNVKKGQTVTVPMENATDWQYVENSKLVGEHLMRASMSSPSAAEQAALREKLPYKLD